MNILALTVCMPWIVYSQTELPANGPHVINPAPIYAGLLGESAFPYTVPEGKVLIIERVSLEAHWGSAMWLWSGQAPFIWQKALETYKTEERMDPSENSMPTVEWFPKKYVAPGTTVNVALASQNQPTTGPFAGGSWRQGWEVSGRICDLPVSE